ncbi:MAG: HlyD family type I secretion periplasmic adaptor subunit [Burkholderiaceae bacterium]|nr:HlyD family type I secretion periplasmic adaptor subunit [Burkholderiaceae bacterium]
MTNALNRVFLGDRSTIRMGWVCLIGLGGFLLWAGTVPLQEGIAASGAVIVQDKRQTVQHLEGGIVERIHIREGQRVAKGAILMTLKGTASQAGRDQVVKQVAALRAKVQRLSALQDGLAEPDFAPLDPLDLSAADRADIAGKELQLFMQQRQAVAAELAVIETRRRAALSVGSARAGQAAIARRSLGSARAELGLVEQMANQQLARRDQVSALERGAAGIEGEMARLSSESREAAAESSNLAAQAVQVRAQFGRQTALDLVEARNELRAVEEQLNAAQDVLDRGIIRAPVAGEVLNLAFNTRSGVVRPGEPIMEIVPTDASITASVRVRPSDRASIRVGQKVRTQILAYRSWLMPRLAGTVVGVSADLKTDEASGQSYYEARVKVSGEMEQRAGTPGIVPGMPVEVFVFSGHSRTTLDYLLEPVLSSLFRGLRAA